MKRIKVNPGLVKGTDDKRLLVHDSLGRVIKYKEEGTEVTKNTHISRMLKCGDLVLAKEKAKKSGSKKALPKTEEK